MLADSLTGLANRRAYEERIEEELLRAQRMGRSLALLLFDVDHLKQMNAAFGHAAGDQLLRAVADTLRSRTRGIDLAARIGADEFVLLLPETDHAGAMVALERLMEGIAEQRIQGKPIQISAGVAVYPDDGRTEDALRKHADDDLYQAKRRRQ
jgi:diguanylate cyclase (GGDEF)-like protein